MMMVVIMMIMMMMMGEEGYRQGLGGLDSRQARGYHLHRGPGRVHLWR
jgi:hypothetical protein